MYASCTGGVYAMNTSPGRVARGTVVYAVILARMRSNTTTESLNANTRSTPLIYITISCMRANDKKLI